LKPTRPKQWQRTSPLAVLFFFGRLLKVITKNAWQSLAPFVAFIYAYQGELVTKIVMGATAFLVISITISVLHYWFFRFQLDDDAILIRQGVIKKKQLDIKFDRIQGINTQQNVVYRYFGLVTISFDTAGSSGSEGNLPAVTRSFAESLRSKISGTTEHVGVPAAATDSGALLRLDWRDMLRIGLADRRALIVFAIIGPLLERLGDDADQVIANYLERAADNAFQFGVAGGVIIVTTTVVGLILLFALVSIGAAFLRYHNFELFLDGSRLQSVGGLLTRHELSMHLSKIQTLRLEQGVVLRWLGRYRLSARQARSSQKQGKDKNFIVPVITAEAANHLRELLLAPEGDDLVQIPTSECFEPISPYYMRSHILFVGLLPALLATSVFWLEFGIASLASLLWLPVVILLSYQSWRRAGYLLSAEGLVRRSGLIGYRSVALLFRKVQRVTVTQSRYQRRKGLASLRVYMASGSVRIPYLGHAAAKQLRDYILYKVESSQLAWH